METKTTQPHKGFCVLSNYSELTHGWSKRIWNFEGFYYLERS